MAPAVPRLVAGAANAGARVCARVYHHHRLAVQSPRLDPGAAVMAPVVPWSPTSATKNHKQVNSPLQKRFYSTGAATRGCIDNEVNNRSDIKFNEIQSIADPNQ